MITVSVVKKQCDDLSNLLNEINLPKDIEEPKETELKPDVSKNFYFTIVAICHQTSPINGLPLEGILNGLYLRGWDYLSEKFYNAVKNDNSLIYPEKLSEIKSTDIIDILEDDNGNSNISDSEGRARLLRDIGQKMLKFNYSSVEDIYKESKGYLIGIHGSGLLKKLSYFDAYSDPVMKKSLFFLSLMKNHLYWKYKDDAKLGPPVDYHEMRGHLRFGTIRVNDKNLYNKILKNEWINEVEDIQIRQAVYDAIILISNKTNNSPSVLHYFFWNLFRNCCKRVETHCNKCPVNCNLPPRYKRQKDILNIKGCLLSKYCISKNKKNKIIEPYVLTEYY
jgi:hypothetical protein